MMPPPLRENFFVMRPAYSGDNASNYSGKYSGISGNAEIQSRDSWRRRERWSWMEKAAPFYLRGQKEEKEEQLGLEPSDFTVARSGLWKSSWGADEFHKSSLEKMIDRQSNRCGVFRVLDAWSNKNENTARVALLEHMIRRIDWYCSEFKCTVMQQHEQREAMRLELFDAMRSEFKNSDSFVAGLIAKFDEDFFATLQFARPVIDVTRTQRSDVTDATHRQRSDVTDAAHRQSSDADETNEYNLYVPIFDPVPISIFGPEDEEDNEQPANEQNFLKRLNKLNVSILTRLRTEYAAIKELDPPLGGLSFEQAWARILPNASKSNLALAMGLKSFAAICGSTINEESPLPVTSIWQIPVLSYTMFEKLDMDNVRRALGVLPPDSASASRFLASFAAGESKREQNIELQALAMDLQSMKNMLFVSELPQFNLLLNKYRSVVLADIEIGSSAQSKVLALLVSLLLACFTFLGNRVLGPLYGEQVEGFLVQSIQVAQNMTTVAQ